MRGWAAPAKGGAGLERHTCDCQRQIVRPVGALLAAVSALSRRRWPAKETGRRYGVPEGCREVLADGRSFLYAPVELGQCTCGESASELVGGA